MQNNFNSQLPNGVFALDLDQVKRFNNLNKERNTGLKKLLEQNHLLDVYHNMVNAINRSRKARSIWGGWKIEQMQALVLPFQKEFSAQNVDVAVCRGHCLGKDYHWLEFINRQENKEYVPPFDVSKLSHQRIKTAFATLQFPVGVAVQDVIQWGRVQHHLNKFPFPAVEALMNEKGLEEVYKMFIDDLVQDCEQRNKKDWPLEQMESIKARYESMFREQNVDVHVRSVDEYIKQGRYGGHVEHFRWIEFVDRKVQPNYVISPVRNVMGPSQATQEFRKWAPIAYGLTAI